MIHQLRSIHPHFYSNHQKPHRLPRCPRTIIIYLTALLYLDIVTIRATATCCFVRSNTGSSTTVRYNRPQQQQQQQQQLQEKNHLTLCRSVREYGIPSSITTDLIRKSRIRSTTNQITHQLPFGRYIHHYHSRNSFATSTTHRIITSSTSISSTTTATALVTGSKIFETTTSILSGLSRTTISSVMVAVTLLISAFCGLLIEQKAQQVESESGKDWKEYLPPSILVTLAVSTTIVYILRRAMSYQLPQGHFIYDFCWSTFLPSSLAFLLFSLPSSQSEALQKHSDSSTTSVSPNNIENVADVQQQQQQSALATIRRLGIPFVIASMGSIIGCFVSFLLCYYNPKKLLSVPEARQATACLCSSFIGGSINFFATAVIIQQQQSNIHNSSGNSHALLSAMAAVDVVVMAFYFTLLSAALQSQRLHRWFNDGETNENGDADSDVKENTNTNMDTTQSVVGNYMTGLNREKHFVQTMERAKTVHSIPAILSIGALTLTLVEISKQIESIIVKQFGVPGTACAFLAIIVPWITTRIHRYFNHNPFWNVAQKSAEQLSRLAFLLVFATMGCTADLSTAMNNGPACLLVSFTALVIHGVVALFGSWLFRRFATTKGSKRIDLTDVLIASNAAIGGPATAAAFCGEIKKSRDPIEKRNITIAATVWGVVGYAIGTTIGVTMFRSLQRFA